MFDNIKDPYQLHNLAGQPQYDGLVQAFDKLLQQKLNETGDKFLPGPEYARMWGYKLNENGTVDYVP